MTAPGTDADVRIRPARTREERLRARTIADAAMLDPPTTPDRWLVAVAGDGGDDSGDGGESTETARVVGALALDGDRIDAIAVRPGRRGRGIGAALVRAAATRRDRLVARFDPAVAPFYEALGFAVEQVDPAEPDGRHRGVLAGAPDR